MPLIKGSEIAPEQQNPIQENPLVRSISQFGQGVTEGTAGLLGLAAQGATLGGLGRTAKNIAESATGNKLDISPQSFVQGAKSIEKGLLPESHLQPQGTVEKFSRNLGEAIPGAGITLATGGAALPTALSTLGGATGETVAEELGFEGIGKTIGSLLGSTGFTKAYNSLQRRYNINPNDLVGTATAAQERLYGTEKKLGEKINSPANIYQKRLLNLEQKISDSGALTSTQRSELISKVQQALGDIKNGSINASSLVARKQQNNAFYRHVQGYKNEKAREYLDQIQSIIFKKGESMGKTYPEWLSSWKDADDITKVIKFGENLKDIAEETPNLMKIAKNPLTKYALSSLGVGGLGFASGAGAPIALGAAAGISAGIKGIQKGRELARFMEKASTRKVLADAFQYSLNRQVPQLAKALNRLEKESSNYLEKHPGIEEELRPKGGLIKGKEL